MDKVHIEILGYGFAYSACQASLDCPMCGILHKEEKTPIVHVFIPSKVFKGWLLQENNCEEELMPSIERWQKTLILSGCITHLIVIEIENMTYHMHNIHSHPILFSHHEVLAWRS
jgi:hypothetical protein